MVILEYDTLVPRTLAAGERRRLSASSPSIYQRRDGVFSRPSVLENAKKMEPAAWWGMYGKHLPLLSMIATHVLAQAGAASAAERNWSVYGQIQTANKSRMAHQTADKLVYCHEFLHMCSSVCRVQDGVRTWSAGRVMRIRRIPTVSGRRTSARAH